MIPIEARVDCCGIGDEAQCNHKRKNEMGVEGGWPSPSRAAIYSLNSCFGSFLKKTLTTHGSSFQLLRENDVG